MDSLFIFVVVLFIASTALGIQCMNDSNKDGINKNFLITMLATNIVALVLLLIKIGMKK